MFSGFFMSENTIKFIYNTDILLTVYIQYDIICMLLCQFITKGDFIYENNTLI